jgi:tRNA (guanine37-N1)-methyltransferase
MSVPPVLLSGHHAEIEKWRRREALARTMDRRPDLLERVSLDAEDEALLNEVKALNKETER